MNFLQQALSYIFTAANWSGPAGLTARIAEHLQYTVVAVLVSALIAIPIGMIIGHTGRGTFLVVTGVNALRALPTLGVLLLGVLLWGLGLVPPTVALMLLGIPPLLAGTYAGIANVDRAVVDAARSMGMTESRVLLRVEVPNAMPLILGGLRTATLQIVAAATVAAYASLGGLGRYLIDGIKVRQFYLALVGALMVTALALILDAALVSRIHCRLEANEETLEVIDLESTNGIYVNGSRVASAHMIPGDRLKVGRVELAVGRSN